MSTCKFSTADIRGMIAGVGIITLRLAVVMK